MNGEKRVSIWWGGPATDIGIQPGTSERPDSTDVARTGCCRKTRFHGCGTHRVLPKFRNAGEVREQAIRGQEEWKRLDEVDR